MIWDESLFTLLSEPIHSTTEELREKLVLADAAL